MAGFICRGLVPLLTPPAIIHVFELSSQEPGNPRDMNSLAEAYVCPLSHRTAPRWAQRGHQVTGLRARKPGFYAMMP